ncbi:hypothetical protein [Leptospira perolatii]|uniref:hypothetical protein n=1 Tax=Leptospira perolatii TaxID=2023191 RepID=UPI0013FD6F3D|nr:hypothetical protein [Leptospira perolatii]
MKQLSILFKNLESARTDSEKKKLLTTYLSKLSESDSAIAICLFLKKRKYPKLAISKLTKWLGEYYKIPIWLIEKSFEEVGNRTETISLLLKIGKNDYDKNLSETFSMLDGIVSIPFEAQLRDSLLQFLESVNSDQKLILLKFLTHSLDWHITEAMICESLSQIYRIGIGEIHLRLEQDLGWDENSFRRMIAKPEAEDFSGPHPFPEYSLWPIKERDDLSKGNYIAEYIYDGARCQIFLRERGVFIWSEAFEFLNHEILKYFPMLEKKEFQNPVFEAIFLHSGSEKLGASSHKLILTDLLEWKGQDLRNVPFHSRRENLQDWFKNVLQGSKIKSAKSEEVLVQTELEPFEIENLEGLLNRLPKGVTGISLKHKNGLYERAAKSESKDWILLKPGPKTLKVVLLYRNLSPNQIDSEFTFGIWKGQDLVPICKFKPAFSEKDKELVLRFSSENVLEKRGPFRSLRPKLTFEISYEGILESPRRKSGYALVRPEVICSRTDLSIHEADHLEELISSNSVSADRNQ